MDTHNSQTTSEKSNTQPGSQERKIYPMTEELILEAERESAEKLPGLIEEAKIRRGLR